MEREVLALINGMSVSSLHLHHFIVKILELKVILLLCKRIALAITECVRHSVLKEQTCVLLLCTALHISRPTGGRWPHHSQVF